MLERFYTFLQTHIARSSEQTFLLTLSGGLDSVVMGHLFYKSNIPFAIAHCNFQLRGQDSELDQDFVTTLAKQWNVPFHSIRFDTLAFSEKHKKSIQIAARELRYDWFEQLRQKHQYNFICTAHHKNDVAETMLYNLSNGTGLRGLHGIKTLQKHLFRPLLFTDKNELFTYAKNNDIEWREDISNQSNYYKRNYIRNKVLPLMKEINPQLIDNMVETSLKLAEAEKVVAKAIEEKKLLKKHTTYHSIDIVHLQQTASPLLVLSELLRNFHFSFPIAKQIIAALKKQSGTQFFSSTHTLVIDRGRLLISSRKSERDLCPSEKKVLHADAQQCSIADKKYAVSQQDNTSFALDAQAQNVCLDMDKLTFPLEIRKWEQKDRFRPLGMKGFKKVSDFLIDQKVPLIEKDNIYVLISKKEICWVVGMRVDDRFKISKNTKKIFYLQSH